MGYLWNGLGSGIIESTSTLGDVYPFSSNLISSCGGGVLDWTSSLVWGVVSDDMVTACGSTLRYFWVLFCYCSTILVCVSVVSSLVFLLFFLGICLPVSNCIKVFCSLGCKQGCWCCIFNCTYQLWWQIGGCIRKVSSWYRGVLRK